MYPSVMQRLFFAGSRMILHPGSLALLAEAHLNHCLAVRKDFAALLHINLFLKDSNIGNLGIEMQYLTHRTG